MRRVTPPPKPCFFPITINASSHACHSLLVYHLKFHMPPIPFFRALLCIVFFTWTWNAIASTNAPPAWQRITLQNKASQTTYDFPVFANHDLHADLREIQEVIFIQHGIRRNGDTYFSTMLGLLKKSGRAEKNMLIIAPEFPTTSDNGAAFHGMPLWESHGWSAGENAVVRANGTYAISAFEVLDDLLTMVSDKSHFPQIRKITFAGHSAGAQLLQRYAILNHEDEGLRANGTEIQYIIANPSSFLYYTAKRPDKNRFIDYEQAQCPNYDQYRYGMQGMLPYAKNLSGMQLFQRAAARKIIYLAGTKDNNPAHRLLDKSCAAEAQGSNRLERALAYWHYEISLAGQSRSIQHQYFEVNGVAHQQEKMFNAVCAAKALFDVDTDASADAASCQKISPVPFINDQ
ncbi:MAG: hypothetical protein KGM99_08390 [Burkholderiales bacterium]|nr:hypothetical protein [Burkholderiales bacterium]